MRSRRSIASDANYVILATPPAFRPMHLKAAIEAGKNVFTEKPVCVDSAGYKTVLAAAEMAKQKGLGIVAGTQRRHHGALPRGDEAGAGRRDRRVVAARAYWNQGGLWNKPREAGWSDMEYQLRNWLYYTWLSGDHIVEQHVHNLDVVNWAMGGPPVRVVGVGGRQARTQPEYGHIYDHFGLDFEYANGVHMMSMCRQQPGTPGLGGRVARGHEGHARDAGRPPLRDHGAERVEVAGRVREPVPAGAHRPHREHPRRQAAQRAEAGGRQHAHGGVGPPGGLHRQGHHLRLDCHAAPTT